MQLLRAGLIYEFTGSGWTCRLERYGDGDMWEGQNRKFRRYNGNFPVHF